MTLSNRELTIPINEVVRRLHDLRGLPPYQLDVVASQELGTDQRLGSLAVRALEYDYSTPNPSFTDHAVQHSLDNDTFFRVADSFMD